MELMWLVYGISVLSGMGMLAGVALLISLLMSGIAGLAYAMEGVKFPFIKTLVATVVLSVAGMVLIPSEKTMYTMAGAYATQKVAEAPETKEIATKVLVIINEKLNAMVKK